MKKRNLIFSGPWQQIEGDVDALEYGGVFIRPMKDGDVKVVKVHGVDYEGNTDGPNKCEVYWFDLKWQDECMFGRWQYGKDGIRPARAGEDPDEVHERWANDKFEPARRCSRLPDTMTWENATPLRRVTCVLDYYGWHASGEPSYQTPGELRRGLLRGAKNHQGNPI